MRTILGKHIYIPVAASLLLAGCATQTPYNRLVHWPATSHTSGQVSSTFPAYQLRNHGDLAAGRLTGGQAVILNNLYYYGCAANGSVFKLNPAEQLTSGTAVRFRADLVETLPMQTDLRQLETRINHAVKSRTLGCALRLVGRFSAVQLESGANLARLSGMIVGFLLPQEGQTVGAMQLYFLSGDGLNGGVVKDFQMIDGSLAIDLCPQYLRIWTAESAAIERLRRQP